MPTDQSYMRLALSLARRGYGGTAPNPMVGAVLVKAGKVIGRGWHRRAGGPHAEIEALQDAQGRRHRIEGATLYVTLEPCSTQGRTPPCVEAIIRARVAKVVAGATDPNPRHQGRGFSRLRRAGVEVVRGLLAEECADLNEAFNHWIAAAAGRRRRRGGFPGPRTEPSIPHRPPSAPRREGLVHPRASPAKAGRSVL